jgi:hypothetical protein
MTRILIPALGALLLAAVLMWVRRRHGTPAPAPASLPTTRGTVADFLHDQWKQFKLRRQPLPDPPPVTVLPPPRPAPPRPTPSRAPAPVIEDGPGDGLGPLLTAALAPIPPDHASVQARIAGYEPENDAALTAFMQGEAAAMAGYGEAWHAHVENLLQAVGLDPAAVQGALELGSVLADTATDVHLALRRFITVYLEVLKFAADGGILPHDGRWLSGEAL